MSKAKQLSFIFLFSMLTSVGFAQVEKKTPWQIKLDSLEHLARVHKTQDTLRVEYLYGIELSNWYSKVEEFGKHIEEILTISKKLNYQRGLAQGYLLNSYKLNQERKLSQSLDFAQNALQIALQIQDVDLIIMTYGELGILNIESISDNRAANLSKGINYIQQQIEWIKKSKKMYYLSPANQKLALAYITNDELEKALLLLYENLKIVSDLEDYAYTENIIGRTLFNLGRYREAQVHLNKAFQITEKLNLNELKPLVFGNMGFNYFNLKQYDEAEKMLHKSLESSTAMPLSKKLIALKMLAQVNNAQNKNDLAYKNLLEYITLNDSVSTIENDKAFLELQTKYETEKKEQENKLLQSQNQRIKTQNILYLVSIIFIVALLLGTGVFYWQSRRKRAILANLNQIKDHLFAIIAHDLKRPAVAFQNLVPVFQYVLKKKQYDRLEDIGTKAQLIASDMSLVLDNLFRWGLSQQGKLSIHAQNTDLCEVVDDLENEFSTVAAVKNIQFETLCPENSIVFSDRTIISSVLRNLLSNAFKFTNQGGLVTLSITKEKDNTYISVKDNGIGIPAELQKRLFELDTTKSRTGTVGEQGSGLGLLLCKELIELNNGNIHVVSKENFGTEVTIHIKPQMD